MNTNPGLIGTKLGNTQIFLDDGEVRRVTAIQAGPCVVVGKRTPDKDGYAALQLGFGNRREKLVNIMNISLNQTLARTILTSGTTLLAVGSLNLVPPSITHLN